MEDKVDRDYLGIEDIVREELAEDPLRKASAIARGNKVAFTLDTPGWKEYIYPYLEKKIAMPAVDPGKEGWEKRYMTHFAIVTVASEIIGIINAWITEAQQAKEEESGKTNEPTSK